jgi:hypothetical protein
MFLARFPYDVLPANRQHAIGFSAAESRRRGPPASTPGCSCR